MTGDWRARRACTLADAPLFDPIDDSDRRSALARIVEAKAICAGCPVRVECLTAGMEDGEHGVHGGEYLRAGQVVAELIRPARPTAACGTEGARKRHRRHGERCAVCWPARAGVVGRPPREDAQPHGTHAAYVRHRSHGEQPCVECVVGERQYQRGRARSRGVKPRGPLQPHGTHAAFVRHYSRGEEPCAECVVGERLFQHERYLSGSGRRVGVA